VQRREPWRRPRKRRAPELHDAFPYAGGLHSRATDVEGVIYLGKFRFKMRFAALDRRRLPVLFAFPEIAFEIPARGAAKHCVGVAGLGFWKAPGGQGLTDFTAGRAHGGGACFDFIGRRRFTDDKELRRLERRRYRAETTIAQRTNVAPAT
jgi:hypothetical protein